MDNQTVRNKLSKFSWGALDFKKIDAYKVFGNGPSIEVKDLPEGGQGFTLSKGHIQLDKKMVLALESASEKDFHAALLNVVSTILHETTHEAGGNDQWIDTHTDEDGDVTTTTSESGAEFEREVWGDNMFSTEDAQHAIDVFVKDKDLIPVLEDDREK